MTMYPLLFNDHWGYLHLIKSDQGLRKFWVWDVLQDELDAIKFAVQDGWKTAPELLALYERALESQTIEDIYAAICAYAHDDLSDEGIRERTRDMQVYE